MRGFLGLTWCRLLACWQPSRRLTGLASWFVFVATALAVASPAAADYSERDDVRSYMAELIEADDFEAGDLIRVFKDATKQQSILDAIARPAEKSKPWHEYRQIFVTDTRAVQGVAFWDANAAVLARAEKEYAVPAQVIVAIIGVETLYGKHAGRYRVIDALATLGFDYPPRAKFFRKELTEYLLLAREEGKDALELTGSYAGAMGYGQFIPSSFREYAVDFDGDGVRDIWTSAEDAIGSVANYFKRHGWKGEGPVVVRLSGDDAKLAQASNQGLKPAATVAELRALGANFPRDVVVTDTAKGALFRMEGAKGAEFWLGLHDFYVITRYNHSSMYALSVHQLSQLIETRRGARLAANERR